MNYWIDLACIFMLAAVLTWGLIQYWLALKEREEQIRDMRRRSKAGWK